MTDTPSLRERKAQLTRDEILAAARRLFAERGYARTSVRDIARAAGVSTQTVYDSIGSKQALVARLNDLLDAEAGIGAIAADAAAVRRRVGRRRHVVTGHPVDPRALRGHRPRPRHRRRRRARAGRGARRGTAAAPRRRGQRSSAACSGSAPSPARRRRRRRDARGDLRCPGRATCSTTTTAGRSTGSSAGSRRRAGRSSSHRRPADETGWSPDYISAAATATTTPPAARHASAARHIDRRYDRSRGSRFLAPRANAPIASILPSTVNSSPGALVAGCHSRVHSDSADPTMRARYGGHPA